MRNHLEAQAGVDNQRSTVVLTNSDYAAAGIQIDPWTRVVDTTPGAAGALALSLPWLADVEEGAEFTIWHHGTTNNTTIDDHNDGIVAIGQTVLTADLDHLVVRKCGGHWTLIEDVST